MMIESDLSDDPLDALAEEFAERLRRGERPGVTEYVERYPALAERIQRVFPALAALEELGAPGKGATGPFVAEPEPEPAPALLRLGEYRIIREVGRGGMGIVYEAVQESLGRQVALKVLPSHGLLAPISLERFRREARAAAQLHHTNIVPVYGVGKEGGIHYFAMQFIRGQSLDAVLGELRRLRALRDEVDHAAAVPVALLNPSAGRGPLTQDFPALASGNAAVVQDAVGAETDGGHAGRPTASAHPRRELTAPTEVPYFGSVARLGVQAAEALAHAHQQGVLHRDVKPANLLLDAEGNLWVTDFGLAKAEGTAGLTAQGDVPGTLRYMAPERFHGQDDARGDIYSLGVTLYELATLCPAFDAPDRARLLTQVLHAEPARPRAICPRIPRDLEAIILKAMAKDPAERYGDARELADDLRRFLADEPVRARRPSPWQWLRKWVRRHRAAVAALIAVVTFTLLIGGAAGSWLWWGRAVRSAEAAGFLDRAESLHSAGKRAEASATLNRGEGLLGSDGDAALQARAATLRADLEMHAELDVNRARQVVSIVTDELGRSFTIAGRAAPRYAEAFRRYDIDVLTLEPGEAAARLRGSALFPHLLEALDDWLRVTENPSEKRALIAVLREADPDPDGVAAALRAAHLAGNVSKLAALADEARIDHLPPGTLANLGLTLLQANTPDTAARLLAKAHHRHPSDFWINLYLAQAYLEMQPRRADEALPHCTAALALNDESALAYYHLGLAQFGRGRVNLAVAAYRRACELQPDYHEATFGLGTALAAQGEDASAARVFQAALKAATARESSTAWSRATLHYGLALILIRQGKITEAIAPLEQAVRDAGDQSIYRIRLADIHLRLDNLRSARAHLEAIRRNTSHLADFHYNFGRLLVREGKHKAAADAFQRAIDTDTNYADAYVNLGAVLGELDRDKEAVDVLRKGLALDPQNGEGHHNLGMVLVSLGRYKEALDAFDEALKWLQHVPDARPTADQLRRGVVLSTLSRANLSPALLPKALAGRAATLNKLGRFEEGVIVCRQALKLNPNYAPAHIYLARALCDQGEYTAGLKAYRRGAALMKSDHPHQPEILSELRAVEQAATLVAQLPAVLSGREHADAGTRLTFAFVCLRQRRFAAAARLFEESFAEDPRGATHPWDLHPRYRASLAALAASRREGKEPPTAAAACDRWRGRALDWLRAELRELRTLLESDRSEAAAAVKVYLASWQVEPGLAAMRTGAGVAALPPNERSAWVALWADVAALQARAALQQAAGPVVRRTGSDSRAADRSDDPPR